MCEHSKDKSVYYSAGKPEKFSVTSDNGIIRFTYDGGEQYGYERFVKLIYFSYFLSCIWYSFCEKGLDI